MKTVTFENYPLRIITTTLVFSISLYMAGSYIVLQYSFYWMLLYLFYIIALEIRLMRNSCINCYYYGRYCSFARGKVAALLFKKGNKKFGGCKISWKEMIPDLLVAAFPVLAGVFLLLTEFNWLIAFLLLLIILLSTAGNSFIRGTLACKFCRQRELGCPAYELFLGKKEGNS